MLTWLRMDQREVLHSIRTAVAAVGSLLIARFCRLPESYRAVVTTIAIMQSTPGTTWPVSMQRFVGTTLGAALGALQTAYAAQNAAAFGADVFVLGLICGTAAHRAKRVPVRGDDASHRHARGAYRACMDDRHPSVPRDFRGNRGRIAPNRCLVGA
jgi:hypothetical protein